MIYKVLIIFILINFFITDVKSNNIDIKYKIEDEIITNTDIINEINYLIALNNNLKSLSNENLYKIAVNSAIKEKIKYIELIKYFDLESNNKELDNLIIQNLNTNFNTNNINDLKIFLNKMNLEFDEVRNKIRVELLWNKLIYDRYINKVSIDKKKLSKKIEKNLLNKSFLEEYFLEEILFELEEKETLIDKYKEINSSDVSAHKSYKFDISKQSSSANAASQLSLLLLCVK